jgi:hypothetical protein
MMRGFGSISSKRRVDVSHITEFHWRLLAKDKFANARPFLCHGSPLRCKIFIVGINPARHVGKSFFSFWDPSYGLRKEKFIKELEQLPGGVRKTRKFIEIVADAAGQKNTLDANFGFTAQTISPSIMWEPVEGYVISMPDDYMAMRGAAHGNAPRSTTQRSPSLHTGSRRHIRALWH